MKFIIPIKQNFMTNQEIFQQIITVENGNTCTHPKTCDTVTEFQRQTV